MGARGPFLQHRESRGIELVDHIAHGLVVAAQQPSNRRGSFPARRCSQDLAATHHKGIGRTQSRLDLVLFVLGERSDKNGCSHTSYCTTLPTTSGGIALGNELAIVTWGRMLCHCSDQVAFSPAFRLFYEEAYCLDITTSSQRQAAISRAHHIPRSAGVAQVR